MGEYVSAKKLREEKGPHPYLGIRAINALLSIGINPYDSDAALKVNGVGESKLLQIPNFGANSRSEVNAWLNGLGLPGFMSLSEVRKKILDRETKIAKMQIELSDLRSFEQQMDSGVPAI